MSDAPVGHLIRNARQKNGITQTALAESLGVSVSYINLIERDRRRLSGKRLSDITAILGLESGALDGKAERRLVLDLEELISDPSIADLRLDIGQVRGFVSQQAPWAEALVAMYRAGKRDQGLIAAFSDRLNHDPVLNDSIHEMLNASTAIRAVASIYEDSPSIERSDRTRFDAILTEESRRLAEVAQSLAGFFDRSDASGTALTAPEEVDNFLFERRNYFPEIEDEVNTIRTENGSPPFETLVQILQDCCDVRIQRVSHDALSADAHRLISFDKARKTLFFAEGLPRSTERFEIARRIAIHEISGTVDAIVTNANDLTSAVSEDRAARALYAYAAASIVMPYDEFYKSAERLRYDIDALSMIFEASPEQLCHRFTTLRRPGAEGVPFGFLRASAAGYLTKRFPLPRLPFPRYGGACPLWAVYVAQRTPELRHRQLVEFPNGDRFFIVARATRPVASAFGQTQPSYSLMLACDALNADRLVYSDGLDLSSTAPAEPVGPTCLLCSRENCAHRQEASIRSRV